MTTKATQPPVAATSLRPRWPYRPLLVGLLALALAAGLWFGLPTLSIHARLAFITFGLAVVGWIFTSINDTYIALAAAIVFTLVGIDEPDQFFEALGDSTIWLLLASFVIAGAVTASGLSRRLTAAVASRARTVNQLFYLLTGVLLLTAFVIPATSGRAALMVPIFVALSTAIGDKRIVKALALLFPTVILLSAVASLIGAGAHLVTVQILKRLGGEQIGFGEWLMLGLPFAVVSCFASTLVILYLFLTREERRRHLQLTAEQLTVQDKDQGTVVGGPLSYQERYALGIVLVLVILWSTESLHGIDNTIVAILGALAVTAPHFGILSFKDGIKGINWNMLLFMAATLELGEALTESGGAEWLVRNLFSVLQGPIASSALFVTSVVAIVSLLSHLLITSRTARSSVLVPLVVLLAVSLGYNPTTIAFLSTAAAGFCLTLPVSAKPVAMFSQLQEPTYEPRDLLRLSSVLLPLHFGLLLAFTFFVWPLLGLTLERQAPEAPPAAPVWRGLGQETRPRTSGQPPAPTPTPWAVFGPNANVDADDVDEDTDDIDDGSRNDGDNDLNEQDDGADDTDTGDGDADIDNQDGDLNDTDSDTDTDTDDQNGDADDTDAGEQQPVPTTAPTNNDADDTDDDVNDQDDGGTAPAPLAPSDGDAEGSDSDAGGDD